MKFWTLYHETDINTYDQSGHDDDDDEKEEKKEKEEVL